MGLLARVLDSLHRQANRFPAIATRLPSTVTSFIRDHISSIEQLEVLLLLRSDDGRIWQAAEISAELKTTPDSVSQRLDDLERDGLVGRTDGGFRFEAGPLAAAVGDLAACYSTHRVAVIETIFSVDREPDSVRSFADAFRVRREPT